MDGAPAPKRRLSRLGKGTVAIGEVEAIARRRCDCAGVGSARPGNRSGCWQDAVMPFPVGQSDMETAEAVLGARLPAALRLRLMRDNGGEVEVGEDFFELFKVLDTSDRVRRARTSARDIVSENQSAREWRGFPTAVVAIADNGTGDLLVLALEGSRLGERAFVWDHETGELVDVGSVADLVL